MYGETVLMRGHIVWCDGSNEELQCMFCGEILKNYPCYPF